MAKTEVSLEVELIPENEREERNLIEKGTVRKVTYEVPTEQAYIDEVDKFIEFLENSEAKLKEKR